MPTEVILTQKGKERGCPSCRREIHELLKTAPEKVDFTCPDCGYHWQLHSGPPRFQQVGEA